MLVIHDTNSSFVSTPVPLRKCLDTKLCEYLMTTSQEQTCLQTEVHGQDSTSTMFVCVQADLLLKQFQQTDRTLTLYSLLHRQTHTKVQELP